MSFLPWFNRLKSTSSSETTTTTFTPSQNHPPHLTYCSFTHSSIEQKSTVAGGTSTLCSPLVPNVYTYPDDTNTILFLRDRCYLSPTNFNPCNNQINSNYLDDKGRHLLLQRYFNTTPSSVGLPTGISRNSHPITVNIAKSLSMSEQDLIHQQSPSLAFHLQSYPGERIPRESYTQLNPNSENESGELRNNNRGSSVLAGISVITNTIIGVALLGVPWVYGGLGIPLGVLLTFVFANLAVFAMYLLSSLAINFGNADESFYSLARKAFPDHSSIRFLVDSLVLVKAVGVGCSYLVVVGDMLPEVVGGAPEWLGKTYFRAISTLMAAVLFVLPASLPKRIRSLRFTNYISLMCLIYVTGVIVFASNSSVLEPSNSDNHWELNRNLTTSVHTLDNQQLMSKVNIIFFESGENMVQDLVEEHHSIMLASTNNVHDYDEPFFVTVAKTLPVFVFMFSCAQNLLSITNELKTRTLSKSLNVITCSVFCALLIYLLVGISGTLSLQGHIEPDVLNCFDSNNLFVWTAKILVIVSVVFSFPLQCHPFRRSLWVLTASYRSNVILSVYEARRLERQFLHQTTLIFIIITTSLALLVRDLGLVFQIVGVLGSTTMSYLMPPIIYLKLTDDGKVTFMRFAAACLVIGSACLIPISLYAIIVSRI